MTNKDNFYLCGGVFFTLLLQIRMTRRHASDKFAGDKDGLSDPDFFKLLQFVATKSTSVSNEGSFKKSVSDYKACEYEGGKHIVLNNKAAMAAFDFYIKKEYKATLERMNKFVFSMLDITNKGKIDWLIRALLQGLDEDQNIPDTEEFYVCSNGQIQTKAQLLKSTNIEFQPFLLGILHFIVTKCPHNAKGREVILMLCPEQADHSEAVFKSNIGSAITHDINIILTPMSDTSVVEEPIIETETDTEENINDFESSNAKVINQYITNPTIVNQKGEKIYS